MPQELRYCHRTATQQWPRDTFHLSFEHTSEGNQHLSGPRAPHMSDVREKAVWGDASNSLFSSEPWGLRNTCVLH